MNYNNLRFLLNKRPKGMPEDDCWALNSEIITDLNNGEVLIKTEYLSIDPYMRGKMNDGLSYTCLLYTSPSPRDRLSSRMPSSA